MREWGGGSAEAGRSTWSGRTAKTRQLLDVSAMAAFQLLFPLLTSCVAASARPPRHLPDCQVVQMDVFCRDLSLRGAPPNLPHGIQVLDLSYNQMQNLTQETLAYHTGLHHLNLHSNKIHSIQPGLFKDMSSLKVLDLSRNHLNVFARSKTNIGPLTAVQSLDLSSNGLYTGMSDCFLADSPSLVNLSLNSNSITKIAQNTFSGSLSLGKISLHNNVILEIEDGAFDSLDQLAELDLSKNSISCITDFNLSHLKVFNLSKNSLELFQSTRSPDLYNLLSLDLSENKMPFFPLLPANNRIEHLDLSRNHLQSINTTETPENRADVVLDRLRYLDMSYNQLKNIPQAFFHSMESLEILNVSNNCLAWFSVTDEGLLKKAKIINLSYNSLQSLTFGENTLLSLEELFLHGNDLTTLDHQTFRRLPSVKFLQLQRNNVRVCSSDRNHHSGCVSFSSIPNLQFLYLSENSLRTLPSHAFANTPLRLLDLSLNPGLDMDRDALAGLEHSLVHLLLKENNISKLHTDLSSLRSLKYVDLSTNQLTTLPMWNKQSSIESLNLQNNHLVTLEYSTILAMERSLKTLYMGSNPLSCCSNLGFLHLVQHSAVVVPDIETVTCGHEEYSEPVSIETVTLEMCQRQDSQNYIVVAIVIALLVFIVVGLLVKCCRLRKGKHNRSFTA